MPAPDDRTQRVYVPATVAMLRALVADRELRAVSGTAFAVTPALREAYSSGDDEELAEVAMAEAARAALRLLAAEAEDTTEAGAEAGDTAEAGAEAGDTAEAGAEAADTAEAGAEGTGAAPVYRRAVVAADVEVANPRPDLDDAVVRLTGPVPWNRIASVHVDLAEAEADVAKAVAVIDAADLGDPDAEFVLGDAEDHQLAWYATQELPFLLDLL